MCKELINFQIISICSSPLWRCLQKCRKCAVEHSRRRTQHTIVTERNVMNSCLFFFLVNTTYTGLYAILKSAEHSRMNKILSPTLSCRLSPLCLHKYCSPAESQLQLQFLWLTSDLKARALLTLQEQASCCKGTCLHF